MPTVKTKADFKAMTTPNLIAYLDGLDKQTFDGYVDADTKVRYFLGKYGKDFAEAIKDTGLFFSMVIPQSMGESFYGSSQLTRLANNFGGIKFNPNIHSDSITLNGKKWAKFSTPLEGIKGHVAVLLADRYKSARDNAKSPEEQMKMIVKAGYDPSKTPSAYLKLNQGNIDRVRKTTQLGRITSK